MNVNKERALEIAVRIAERRAELAALEKQFAVEIGAEPRALVLAPARRGRKPDKAGEVLRIVGESGATPMTPKQIAVAHGNINPKYVQLLVVQLAKAGRLERVGPGQYRTKAA